MEPHVDKSPGLALPQPSREVGGHAFAPEQGQQHVEQLAAAPETALQPPPPHFGAPQGPVPLPAPQDGMAVAPPVAALPTADDDNSDALDQEWVNKAKAIVERTKTDPYVESQELGRAKAEYLRIRYNKHIKVAEEPAR